MPALCILMVELLPCLSMLVRMWDVGYFVKSCVMLNSL